MELLPVGNTLVQLVANSDKDEDSVHQALLPYDSGNQDNVTATLAEEGRKLARESECKQEMSGGNAHSVFRLRMMTFNVCFGAFALGIIMALPGPTLLDLTCNTSSDLGSLSYVFTARSAGYLAGSIIGGFLFDIFEENMLLGISQVIATAGTLAIPFCKDVVMLAISVTCEGLAMGFLDTGGNVLLLRLWSVKSPPYTQALHFAFASGSFVAPILAKPFLTTLPSNTSADAALRECTANGRSSANVSDVCGVNYTPNFQYSFWISAILLFVSSLGYFYFRLAVRLCPSKVDRTKKLGLGNNDGDESNESQEDKRKYHTKSYTFQLLSLLFVFYFCYNAIEVTYGEYIASYAVCRMGFSKGKAAVLTSVFWALFALSSGGSVLLAACKLPPGGLLLVEIIGSITAVIVLSVFLSSEVMLWIGTAVLGASIASMFPTMISWVEQYIELTGKRAAVFVVGSSCGEMVLPLVTGRLFTTYDPAFVIYCTSAAIATLTLTFIVVFCRAKPSRMENFLPCILHKKRRISDISSEERDEAEEIMLSM